MMEAIPVRSNKKTKFLFVWSFIAAYFVFNIIFIGIMPSRTRYSLDSERHETWLDTGKFLTKAELAGGDDLTPIDRARPWAWSGFLASLVVGIFSAPIIAIDFLLEMIGGSAWVSRKKSY